MYRSTLLLLVLSVLSFLFLFPVILPFLLWLKSDLLLKTLFPVILLSPLVEVRFVIQDKLDAQHEVGQWQSQGQ